MTQFSKHNLCPTVEPRVRYETQRCKVGHAINPHQNGGRTWSMSHTWSDRKGGLASGVCTNCGKTLKEVRVRVNPKTGAPVRRTGTLAHLIATTPADVPPIR